MNIAGSDKKQTGCWGERIIDKYMIENSWYPVVTNRVIRGGEIDRVYAFSSDSFGVRRILLCVSEVKTTQVTCVREFDALLSDSHFSRFAKPRQMRNLKKYGEAMAAVMWRNAGAVELHARLFVVARIQVKDGDSEYQAPPFCGKILARTPSYWIFSCDPDVSGGRWRH
jgi:hypothetical protein